MQVTQRFWAVCASIGLATLLAVLLESPLLYGVPAGLGGWLVTRQLAFAATVSTVQTTTQITQTVTPNPVLVEDTTSLTVHVDRTNAPTPALTLTLDPNPGLQLTDTNPDADTTRSGSRIATREDTATVPDGVASTTITATIHAPVAGSFTLRAPHVTLHEDAGLFTETIPLGTEPTVTVTPRVPRDIHVGTGGERMTLAHGTHDAERGNTGFEPAELHKYVPGDPANRIDWKATARLGEPFVREYDAQTTRQTILLLDTRPSMTDGQPGETKLDYAREICLWLAEYAHRVNDPATMHVLNDRATATGPTLAATDSSYQQLRRRILAIDPTHDPTHTTHGFHTTSRTAHARAADLDTDKFSQTLAPYFQDATTYFERVTETPLFETAHRELQDISGPTWVPIITDDTHREELLETVQLLTDKDTHVAAFLLPSVLFTNNGLTDLETAYTQYTDFENYRQRIASIQNAAAFEVGPRDRLEAILNAPTTRRQTRQ